MSIRLIVGLGNPGSKYAATRHNVGFRVLDLLARRLGIGFDGSKYKALFADTSAGAPEKPAKGEAEKSNGEKPRILLAKPQTYMNLSGWPVAGFAGAFELPLEQILVVVDDVALPLGTLRMRRGGSAGGHNGLKDIEEQLGSPAYPRLRIGVGHADKSAADLVEHVLGPFTAGEEKTLEPILALSAEACLAWIEQGIEYAMNRFNIKPRPPEADAKDKTGQLDQTERTDQKAQGDQTDQNTNAFS